MAIYSSGNQISLQGTGDTNPTGQTFYLDTTITSSSTSCSLVGFTRMQELGESFYNEETTLSGTIYGFKTSQTAEVSGTTRLARGFDDTNPNVTTTGGIQGSGFFANDDWFGDYPVNPFGNEIWWTSAGVVGVTLGVDESGMGSISTQSYTGGGSVGTLEVHHFGWFNNASSNYPNGTTLNTSSEGNWIMLTLKNTSASPPDSDDSFYSVIINGQEFLRSDAATVSQSSNAAYDSNVSSGTHYYRTWRWDAADVTDSDLSAIGTTGSKTFKLSKSASSTLNTGIAEEMGGADSADVKMSDYYKSGTFHKTSGIPESGEISFSDFFDKTFTPLYLYSVSYRVDYWDRGVSGSVAERFSGWSDRSGWLGNTQYDGHRGSGESAEEPTSSEREFPDGVTFCNLSNSGGNKLKFSALTANGGYVFTGNLNPVPAIYTLSVTYPGNVTSTATNSGWTRLRAWGISPSSGVDDDNPGIVANRSDATFTKTYYSGSNITELLYTWDDEDVTFGTGYSNTYSSVFGNSTTSSNNDAWLVQID